jgi:WhiB family redox-sensing transcriptional regulator
VHSTALLPRTEWPKRSHVDTCRTRGCNAPALPGDELGLCADCGQLQRSPSLARLVRKPHRRPDGDLPHIPAAPEWGARQGACAGRGHDDFFSENPVAIAQAKALCLMCPVRPGCLQVALARPALVGVWGGLTEGERSALRRSRRKLAS